MHNALFTAVLLFAQSPENAQELSQLEKTYQELASRFENETTLKHVQLGTWCSEKGLFPQMFEQFDIALRKEPKQEKLRRILEDLRDESVLRLLHIHSQPLAQANDWIQLAAGKSPSKALFAEIQLSKMTHEMLSQSLVRNLLNLKKEIRGWVAQRLKDFPESQNVGPLVTRSLIDPEASVRQAAIETLKSYNKEEVQTGFLQALNEDHTAIRTHAAEALGSLGQAKAVPFLIEAMKKAQANAASSGGGGPRSYFYSGNQVAYIRDYDVQIATAASIAKPMIGVLQTGSILDVRVLSVREEITYSLEIRTIRNSLVKLTGYDAGQRASDWNNWWVAQSATNSPKSGS